MAFLYIDCSAGASGDMLLAALVDLGFPLGRLRGLSRQLAGKGYRVGVQRVRRGEERALRLVLNSNRPVRFHTPEQMRRCVRGSRWPVSLQREMVRLIDRLARAESRIHRVPVSRVYFHQLAAADTLAALCGFCAAVEYLKIQAVYLSPIPIGAWHRGHDGRWRRGEGPVTGRLLSGSRVIRRPHRFEWTTPTAALLLSSFRSGRGGPPLRVLRIGRSVGRAAVPQGSGLLRLLLCKPMKKRS